MFPLAHFLRQELRDAPGRASYTLRLTLSCAVLITLFMTLQIPFLAVALIVVFYVSQPNVLMIKLVSVVFFVTVTVALGGVLLIIKWTYDYPLIRLAASVALFFCALYLMRVLGKLGLAFFVVALAVIYAQTFPSMTSQSEILVRLLLWLWVAINTAILVTLLVNACFQQAFPGNQFKARLAGMLHEVARRLAAPDAEAPPTFGETAAQFNQLQSLFAQASRATPEIAADPQAWRSRLAATLRCYQLAALLQADEADSDDRQQLSQAVLQLKNALSEEPFDGAIPPLTLSGRGVNRAVLQEMATTLQRLAQGIHIPMLYVSHSLDEIQHLADRVLVLEAGKVKAFGPLEEVWSSSVMHPWLPAEQQSTILSATVAAQHPQYAMTALALGDQLLWVNRLERPAGDTARIRIQASDVSLTLAQPSGTSIRNILRAEVAQCLEVNGQIEVQLRVSDRLLWARISPWARDDLAIAPGQQVFAQIKSVSIAA